MASLNQEEYNKAKKSIYNTAIILFVVTIVEVICAYLYEEHLMAKMHFPRWPLQLFVIAASFAKAYWIMKVFMHVEYEKKGFILTITAPFVLFIWFIIAFAYEGNYWSQLREVFMY